MLLVGPVLFLNIYKKKKLRVWGFFFGVAIY
jgi:hypothetical protein